MKMIEYTLDEISHIQPLSSITWFSLSEGTCWLNFEQVKFYERTLDDSKLASFPSYQTSRFVEDFQDLFEAISDPIPDDLFVLVKTHLGLKKYTSQANNLLEKYRDDVSFEEEKFYEEYDAAFKWLTDRTLSALHFNGNPQVSFFRNKNELVIVWDAEKGHWTAGAGQVYINYSSFVSQVEDFKGRFFASMLTQIERAALFDWKGIPFDSSRCFEEHNVRKEQFDKNIAYLKFNSKTTDWDSARRVSHLL